MTKTHDLNVLRTIPLVSPRSLKEWQPITGIISDNVAGARHALQRLLTGEDKRFLAVVGPCSIHDEKAAIEYAERLNDLRRRVQGRIYIVMRVYFEKPRTTVGWKGLINDPHMNDSFDIDEGLHRARRILLELGKMGLPAGTEMLEPITPQYIDDLVVWASIGARTTESPTHRQMASGLSMPVGFKNSTDGSIEAAINAMKAAEKSHSFLGIDHEGQTAIIKTRGNADIHLILRGGRGGTNYDASSVKHAEDALKAAGLNTRLVVDCSHANSEKDHTRQEVVWHDVVEQKASGDPSLLGAMLESNLCEGRQSIPEDISQLQYGVSVTDACLGWEKTEELILWAHEKLG